MESRRISAAFIVLAIASLFGALLFGLTGALQYIIPGFLYEIVSFEKARPLHVTLILTWLFSASVGSIYYFIHSSRSVQFARTQFILMLVTGTAILYSYFSGIFGGREYLEFPPLLALPMGVSWLFFLLYYFRNTGFKLKNWKIYNWMWATGILFFLITFIESYAWNLRYVNGNIVRDITIQWKAMGAFTGSWNMLIYGIAFYLMDKISGSDASASGKTWFFYFLGLTNLLFNWGHHTYNLPAAHWIRTTAYLISMTELLLLGNIIYTWRNSVKEAVKNSKQLAYRFLMASDVWIFLNLGLAILISIPAVNIYTHGTHITVAHAMGATIGINTMILLSSIMFIAGKERQALINIRRKRITGGLILVNVSLLVFWASLLSAGLLKASHAGAGYYELSALLKPCYIIMAVSGGGIATGLVVTLLPVVPVFVRFNFSTFGWLIKKRI